MEPPALLPLSIPQTTHPLTVARPLGASQASAEGSSPGRLAPQASGSGMLPASVSVPTSAATPASSSSLFLFDNPSSSSSPLSPSFPSSSRPPFSRPSHGAYHHSRHHYRSRSDSVSSAGSSTGGGGGNGGGSNCVRRPALSATSAFFSPSTTSTTTFPIPPPPLSVAWSPPLYPSVRTPSPPPPTTIKASLMLRRPSLRSRRSSGGGSANGSPRLNPSTSAEDGFLFMGSTTALAPRPGSPSPLNSPLLRRNSEDGGSRGGGVGWDESAKETIMEEDEGNSGSGGNSKTASREELRGQANAQGLAIGIPTTPTPTVSVSRPAKDSDSDPSARLTSSSLFSPLPSTTPSTVADPDAGMWRSRNREPSPSLDRQRKVEERAALLEQRLDKLLLDMQEADDEESVGMRSLGFGAVMVGGGGTSPMPGHKALEEEDAEGASPTEVEEDEEDEEAGWDRLPIRFEPSHRLSSQLPARGILLSASPSSLFDPTIPTAASSRRPSSTLVLSRASSRSCDCATCSASSSEEGGSSEEAGGEGCTGETSPALSEGKKVYEAEAEWVGVGVAMGRVRFCEAAAEEIITWSATTYDRKGPPPVAKLTMRDVLELREIKEQLGIAVDLALGFTASSSSTSTSTSASASSASSPAFATSLAQPAVASIDKTDVAGMVSVSGGGVGTMAWSDQRRMWGGGGSLWC